MEQILANLNPQVSSSGSSPIRIPVFYFLLRQSNGTTSHGSYDIEQSINAVNNHFDGLFEFYVCGQEPIDNDQFNVMNVNASSPDVVDLHQFVNMNYPVSKECIKVFFCDGIEWASGTPGGITFNRIQYGSDGAVYCYDARVSTLSHELGHYFGVPHTFAEPNLQYVHDINTPIFINNVKYTCKHTGDGFCDTPADLENDCSENVSCTFVTCTVSDPLGVMYSPDPTNLMSYYTECAFRFSLEQQERMNTIYSLHPNYEELRIINPECALKTGYIEQSCVKSGESFPEPFKGLNVDLRQPPALCSSITNSGGRYQFNPCNWLNGKRFVMPDRNFSNPDNGVTTYDMVLISKHILGIQPFTSPFQIIAADANNSGSVTTFDNNVIKKVILGIEPNFPENRSWRYISKYYLGDPSFFSEFNDGNPFNAQIVDPFVSSLREYRCPTPNPGDPQPPIPNNCTWMDHVSVVTTNPVANLENTWSFVGVKVGDVNCGAITDGFVEEDPDETFFTTTTGIPISVGSGAFKKIQVIAESEQEVVAWQLGASFSGDSLELLSFLPGNVATTFDLENFHHADGGGSESGISKMNALWFAQNGVKKDINNKVLFEFVVHTNAPIPALESFLHLNASGVTPSKFYNESGEEVPVNLRLNAVNFAGARDVQNIGVENQLSKVSVVPVPFDEAIVVNFSLAHEANVGLQLYHADGRLVTSVQNWLTKGSQEMVVDGLADAPSGVYYYSLFSEGFTHHGVISKK
jgi:hypothetical protein